MQMSHSLARTTNAGAQHILASPRGPGHEPILVLAIGSPTPPLGMPRSGKDQATTLSSAGPSTLVKTRRWVLTRWRVFLRGTCIDLVIVLVVIPTLRLDLISV
jgi:hypothetical protein